MNFSYIWRLSIWWIWIPKHPKLLPERISGVYSWEVLASCGGAEVLDWLGGVASITPFLVEWMPGKWVFRIVLSGVGGGHFQPRIPSTIHQPSSAYTKDGKENCDLLQLFLASNQIHITFSGQIRQLPRIDDRRFAERHHDVKSPKKNIARIRGELDRRSWSGDIGATWYQADIAWDDGHQWLQVHHATSQRVQVV